MEKKLQDRITVTSLALFCLALYLNSLWNLFVFDDLHTIVHNLYIKDWRNSILFFKGLYSSEIIPKGMFRPFLMLTFSFNYLFSGLHPLGYHIINILIHFLNGILLYSLFRFLRKDTPFGLILLLSLLFIAHPLNSETVNYISCRSDLLVTFFILAGFLSYLKGRFLLPLFLYALGLLSKETALVFPLLLFAYDFILRESLDIGEGGHSQSAFKWFQRKGIFYIVIIGISISYWVYRSIVFSLSAKAILSAPLSSPIRSFSSNILTQAVITLFYLKLFIWPHPLNIHHTIPIINSLFNPLAYISVIAIMIMVILIFILRKRQPFVSFNLAWYLICLFPKFYAVLNYPAMEHHFYLPSFGLYLIIASLTGNLYLKYRRKFIYLACGLLGVFTILVCFRNHEWRDAFSLWQATAKNSPSSATAHNNLGIEYAQRGLTIEAKEEFNQALSLSKDKSVHLMVRQNLAGIYLAEGKFQDAIEQLNEAIRIHPNYYFIYHLLGNVYIKQGKTEEAEKAWVKGLSVNPLSSDIQEDFGFLYLQQNRLKEAKDYFQKAIRSDPDAYLAYFGLGQVLELESDIEGAIKDYLKSLRLKPNYAYSYYRLGRLYVQKADRRALRYLKEAVILAPDYAVAHNDLAVFYDSMDPPQLELARKHAQKAIALGYKVDKEFLKKIDLLPE